MRPTTATATGVGEGDDARSPEDVRAAFLQRKAARRAAGRAALRTAVSDDEKAARSAALLADRRARAVAARLALRTHPERGRPGLVITADAADASERRRQEVVSSLRTAHARMAAAPPPCTEIVRWRPIDQRPFWLRPGFRALLCAVPSRHPSATAATLTDLMSDDDVAPDDTSEVAMPRNVDESPRGTAAEALVDLLWQFDRPVACTAVVGAQSHPAGRAVDAEVKAALPSRLRTSQRPLVPRRWHPCDAPAQVAQVARTAVAVAPQHGAVDDAAAAAAMIDADAEVEATPPPRPRRVAAHPR